MKLPKKKALSMKLMSANKIMLNSNNRMDILNVKFSPMIFVRFVKMSFSVNRDTQLHFVAPAEITFMRSA